jgi:hypothetical protein
MNWCLRIFGGLVESGLSLKARHGILDSFLSGSGFEKRSANGGMGVFTTTFASPSGLQIEVVNDPPYLAVFCSDSNTLERLRSLLPAPVEDVVPADQLTKHYERMG